MNTLPHDAADDKDGVSDSVPKPLSDALHSVSSTDVVLQTFHRLIVLLLLRLQVGDNISVVRDGQEGVNALLPRWYWLSSLRFAASSTARGPTVACPSPPAAWSPWDLLTPEGSG